MHSVKIFGVGLEGINTKVVNHANIIRRKGWIMYKITPSLEPLRELRLQSNQAHNSQRDKTLQKDGT